MKIIFVSDTHFYPVGQPIPDGDVLVHAGDLTTRGTMSQIRAAGSWLAALPHHHKVVIAGNHDFGFENPQLRQEAIEALGDVHYLEDTAVEIDGVLFWGSPRSLRFFDWAFQLDSFRAAAHWAKIPERTDVVITHGPPRWIGDRTTRGDFVGDEDLAARIAVVKPRIHVFGHIHEGYGVTGTAETTYINASICDENYGHVNRPIEWELR